MFKLSLHLDEIVLYHTVIR